MLNQMDIEANKAQQRTPTIDAADFRHSAFKWKGKRW
jgi:hypothetical protein